ncbi:hypothetical protein B0T24DRAFT_515231 [Lasiosphaeria ovina]|uniref:Myb-like domain-containing protein n=1 Tax=Lasiosphaeria ovina TaxID=92902 RepID=A0AAE0NKB4_9PEZI|nr:hypothetical protein B0T24DRAFT_515231 [Lasiosphaeria ovina]
MDSDRKEEQPASPVVEPASPLIDLPLLREGDLIREELLQDDGLGSDWEDSSTATSPIKPFKRLRIHVDMTSSQYLTPGAHHHSERLQANGLPTCSSGPPTGAYTSAADLDPFSAASGVSSFNYPAAADASLLTPVSSAGSPPLQQQQRPAVKPLRGYHSSQTATAAGTQMPTPPNTSKMYYGYEMNSNSQSSSPMTTVHPQVTEGGHFDMTPYIAQSPVGTHNPSSPKIEIPPPIDPYLGHFTVSGGNEADVAHHSFHDYHAFSNVEVDHSSGYPFRQPPHVSVSGPHMHHRMPSNGGQAPILTQPHPSQFRPQTTPQVGGIEDLRDPSMLMGAYPPHTSLSPGRRVQPRKKPTPARKPTRTPKSTPNVGSPDGQGVSDEDREELTLREDAPEDDKYLFQLRKEFISEKGKGMWEEMKARYSEKHQGNWEKAALQMKVSRAVAKFGVWPKREIERLKEAHRYYEDKRYQLILARMKENGGCRVWDWKPQHVEAMLVKLGMEEPTVDEKTGTRRRKNKAARRRAGSQNGHHHASNVMNDWSNGLGLHPAFQGHPHHVAAARQASFDIISDDASIAPTFSSEQENEYLDHIFQKQAKVEHSLSPEIMELSYEDDGGSRPPTRDLNHQHSERVARQACEQMMQQQTRVEPFAAQ